MSQFIAALPMYDWPEMRAETDAQWARMRDALRDDGVDAPDSLTRRNSDMPAVPGGIRNAAGTVIAPDPATLPLDDLDVHGLWRHPALLLGQTCWGPMELGLGSQVRVIGQPDYSAFEGGSGPLYSSAIIMRRNSPSLLREGSTGKAGRGRGAEVQNTSPPPRLISQAIFTDPPHKGEGKDAPRDGRAILPLDLMRGARFAYNGDDSMSGIIALTRDLEAAGETLDIFSEQIVSGAHRASVVAVAEGRADVCSVDCRSWDLIHRFEPAADAVQIVGWTGRRKGLPYIASVHLPDAIAAKVTRAAIETGLALAAI